MHLQIMLNQQQFPYMPLEGARVLFNPPPALQPEPECVCVYLENKEDGGDFTTSKQNNLNIYYWAKKKNH